jgi:hypothetical protein
MTDIEKIVKTIETYSPELAAEEILLLFSVSSRREQLIAFFDKATDNDIQECINGFAGRVFDRLEGN